ncbi:MAG: tRNA (N(6)-L-threonylcarbamoyladenosine(37)-C(2))-methylthiotransferase MtaB [Bacteroidia bacterium]|nr:tRNA (N(6)-L-threonylcarbamoyladenosine(37)-C(2))-methylthiotransferase MtaB [Bacteroidia bacterium]MDW8088283.1 tRNA (N(6)-L-threonylcarbamoyladenosine(37)-C(2))-methylthiotransferase MtaB [Bacteroidia bacterium]
MARIAFYTLGCKLNFAETATLARQLVAAGHVITDWEAPADVYVLNTCAVTHQAERKAHKILRQLHRRAPQAKLVITGCYAQRAPEAFQNLPGVALVATNAQKPTLAQAIEELIQHDVANPGLRGATEWAFWPSSSGEGRTRAFLKVQDGCDYRCSFCIVPKTRGPSRSAPPEAILQEVQRLAAAGFQEIVLTGINLGDYGKPHGIPFLELLRRLEAEAPPTIRRFRLSSIEPNLLSDEVLDFVAAHPRWAPHFHLPLQSGSDRILRLMRRRYQRALYEGRIQAIRQRFPHAGIGVDVIVGFPSESEEDFRETYRFLEELPVSYLHVFPYSERPGTVAATLPGSVPWPERLARSEALRLLSLQKKRTFAESCLGQVVQVLIEEEGEGLSENYLRVQVPSASAGEWLAVKLIGLGEDGLAVGLPLSSKPEIPTFAPHGTGGLANGL